LVSSLALFFTIGQFDPTQLATRHAIVMHLWTNIALDGLFISAGVLAIVLVLGITHRVERMGQHAAVARPTPLLIAEGAR